MRSGEIPEIRSQYGIHVWGEVVLLPLVAMSVALWLDHGAPFTASSYPWIWLIPLLIGLRYGLAAAALSSLTLVGAGMGAYHLGWSGQPPPLKQLVGGVFAALSAGQYRSRWHAQLSADGARTEYTEQRLELLTRAFFITRLSHDRLEEALITQPVTLRSALELLRVLSFEARSGISTAGADALLQLLAQYCRFETMALHLYRQGRLQDEAIAALGPAAPLARTDPLLVDATEHEQTGYYSVDQLDDPDQEGHYRAVFPLIDAAGQDLGVLVVRDMPLLALTEENLTVATAILQYVADESWASAQTVSLHRSLPACPVAFAHELVKLQHLHVTSSIRSMLIALHAPGTGAGGAVLDVLYSIRRGLDLYWRDPFGTDRRGLLILLPLAGPSTAQGFLERIDEVLTERGWSGGLAGSGIHVHQVTVSRRTPLELLADCGVQARLMATNLGTVVDTWMHPASAGAAIVPILSLLLANALFSLLFAAITQGLLPRRLRQHPVLNVLTLTVFGSLLPAIGPILLLLLGLICPHLEKRQRRVLPRLLLRPAYVSGVQSKFSYFGAGGALVRLRNAQPGSPQGSRALLAIETQRNQESIRLISDALSHPDETLRLLAHNLLAKREESIVGHMSRLEARLGRDDHRNRARTTLELAELHLEFLYLGFATGSLKAMHLNAAQRLLDDLGEPPESVPWRTRFLLLRARLQRQFGTAASETAIRQDYERALSAGAAPARALPWLLEQAWRTRDYAQIRELLTRHRLYTQIPLIGPVAERWERSRP